jgi:dTDP-glucose 4,6-dehydratase
LARRLLVTGGAGFIGANFVHYWTAAHPGDRVVVLDALTYAGNRASLDPLCDSDTFRFVHGSINDLARVESLVREETIDTIVNFAAESHVDRSISAADVFLETNVLGTHTLLKAARQVWIDEGNVPEHRFHQISTDEVYGSLEPGDPTFTESTPCAPSSPYSASKAAADHLVRAYGHTYGLGVTTSRCSNNYGPFQFPEKLIPLVIVKVLAGEPVPIYGDGLNVRDWLHVADHCRALGLILERGTPGETYNVGGGDERENLSLVEALCSILDERFAQDPSLKSRFPDAAPARGQASATLIRFVADRPGHDRRYAIDASRMSRELGFSPSVSLTDGLRLTVAWYLEHEPSWLSVCR